MRPSKPHNAGQRQRVIKTTTWTCPFCGHVWTKMPPAPRSRCPGCQALVEGRGWIRSVK